MLGTGKKMEPGGWCADSNSASLLRVKLVSRKKEEHLKRPGFSINKRRHQDLRGVHSGWGEEKLHQSRRTSSSRGEAKGEQSGNAEREIRARGPSGCDQGGFWAGGTQRGDTLHGDRNGRYRIELRRDARRETEKSKKERSRLRSARRKLYRRVIKPPLGEKGGGCIL